jgi:phage gp45-like
MRVKINKLENGKCQIEMYKDQIIDKVEYPEMFGFSSRPDAATGVTLPDSSTDELVLISANNKIEKPSLEYDEVVIYNSDSNYIKFMKDEILIKTKNTEIEITDSDITLTSDDFKFVGNVEIDGELTVKDKVIFDKDIEITGKLQVTDKATFIDDVTAIKAISALGKITSFDDVMSGTISGKLHTHLYITPAIPAGSAPTNPPA